jgi:hypothetical protein
MADEYTGKVAYQMERERYYAIPDHVQDNMVNPDQCRTVNWVPDNDDDDDPGGHFELVPESEDTFPVDESESGTWNMTLDNEPDQLI